MSEQVVLAASQGAGDILIHAEIGMLEGNIFVSIREASFPIIVPPGFQLCIRHAPQGFVLVSEEKR